MKPPTRVVWWQNAADGPGPDPALMLPVTDDDGRHSPMMLKPNGGLWTSPEVSEASWEEWAHDNMPDMLQTRYILTPKPGTRLIRVDSLEDLNDLGDTHGGEPYSIGVGHTYSTLSFEKMAKEYDGLWLTARGFYRTRMVTLGRWMLGTNGWDCETVLWFHWSFSEVVKDDPHPLMYRSEELEGIT